MAKQNVSLSNTFNEWRLKTNTIGAWLGDADTITPTYVRTFTGVGGGSPNGNGVEFTIGITAGVYSLDAITAAGSGYVVNDDIVIPGSSLGGVDGVHDCTINVDSIGGSGEVGTASFVSGAVSPDLAAEFNISVSDIYDLQIFTGEGTLLDTDATDLADAINENHAEVTTATTNIGSTVALTTTATNNLVSAINELDNKQGGDALTTTSNNISGAINELDAQIGSITSGAKGEILYELYGSVVGNMTDDYAGTENNILAALNYLHAASDAATLEGEYLKLNGSNDMDPNSYFTVSNFGIRSKDTEALVLSTKNAGNSDTARITIADSSGNVGIATTPHATHKVDVSGSLNATTLFEGGTAITSTYPRLSVSNAMTGTNTFTGSTILDPGATKSLTIDTHVVSNDTYDFKEWIQDTVGAMVSSNTETGGIAVTYQDSDGTLDFVISNNGHSHTFANISDGPAGVQGVVGGMVTGNTESGITVVYQSGDGTLDFTVPAVTTYNVTDTDSGFTWAATGNVSVTGSNETLKYVSGAAINVDVDATSKAVKISHVDTSSQASVNNSNGTVIQDVTLDTYGHITGLDSTNLDTRYSQVAFNTINPTSTDSGFTWDSATNPADIVADAIADTLTVVEGVGIDLASDATADALRIGVNKEWVQDSIGEMLSGNSESGIVVTYNDGTNKIDFDVNDPTIALSGDVTGSAVMSNLGSIDISCTLSAPGVDIYDVNGTKLN